MSDEWRVTGTWWVESNRNVISCEWWVESNRNVISCKWWVRNNRNVISCEWSVESNRNVISYEWWVESNRNVISDVWVIDDIFTFALLICFYKYKNHLINLILIAMIISFVTIYVVNKHCLWYNLWRTKTFITNCVCLLYSLF